MKRSYCLAALFILSACSGAEKQNDVATEMKTDKNIEKDIRKDAQSLEQAADEAVKLIEEDASAEMIKPDAAPPMAAETAPDK